EETALFSRTRKRESAEGHISGAATEGIGREPDGMRPGEDDMSVDTPVVVWFRDDLRVADHAALYAAVETGRPVVAVYVLDEAGPWALGGASRCWLHHSLTALRKQLRALGCTLVLRSGDTVAVMTGLVAASGATDVFV